MSGIGRWAARGYIVEFSYDAEEVVMECFIETRLDVEPWNGFRQGYGRGATWQEALEAAGADLQSKEAQSVTRIQLGEFGD